MLFKLNEEWIDALWARALGHLPFASRLSEPAQQAVLEVFLGLPEEIGFDRLIGSGRAAAGADDGLFSSAVDLDFCPRFARAAQDRLIAHGSYLAEPIH